MRSAPAFPGYRTAERYLAEQPTPPVRRRPLPPPPEWKYPNAYQWLTGFVAATVTALLLGLLVAKYNPPAPTLPEYPGPRSLSGPQQPVVSFEAE